MATPPPSNTTTKTACSLARSRASATAWIFTARPSPNSAAFHEAVEDYVATCAKVGKSPQKPYSGNVMFRISPQAHANAALAAELSGKSLNQWAAEKLTAAALAEVG